jgi:hypothetical protein
MPNTISHPQIWPLQNAFDEDSQGPTPHSFMISFKPEHDLWISTILPDCIPRPGKYFILESIVA